MHRLDWLAQENTHVGAFSSSDWSAPGHVLVMLCNDWPVSVMRVLISNAFPSACCSECIVLCCHTFEIGSCVCVCVSVCMCVYV